MNKRNPSLFPMAGFLTVGVIPGWDKGIIMLRSIGSVTFLALLMVGCGGGGGDSGSPPPPPYTVGGTVSGLVGSGLTLEICSVNKGGSKCHSPLQVGANGAFTLDSAYPAVYWGLDFVSIAQQPSSPPQRCVISNARVSIQNANDTSVTVSCADYLEHSYVTNAADNTLSSYSVNATTGAVAVIGTPTATGGASPQAIVGGEDYGGGRFVFVANQGSNDVSAFAVNATTGALTAAPGSPFPAGTDPQAMALYGSPLYLYVANAGSDNMSAYIIDATTGALTGPYTIATGKSPTSIVVDPQGSQIYVANHGGSNDISEFYSDLTPVPGSPFPAGGNPLSLALGANGKFLYSANPDATNPSISGFSVDPNTGALSPLSGSPFPLPVSHYIATDQTGAYLYVTSGANVVGYGIDATTGALTPLPGFPVAAGANAYSITIDPTNQILYVTNDGAANVSGFTLDASTGALTPMSGSPFPAGNHPEFIATFLKAWKDSRRNGMDESHLIAPTVHGNTADLPTALASIIGLAGMETRVDHRDPGWLGAWQLQDRCRQGFDLPEVEHLCRRIYCKFDGIPMALRAHATPRSVRGQTKRAAKDVFYRTQRRGHSYALREKLDGIVRELRATTPITDPARARLLETRRAGVVSSRALRANALIWASRPG